MEEPHELHERAEKGREDPGLAPVSVTMSLLAVLVAVVSLFGFRLHDEEILTQTKATDQWAYYQAKDIRLRTYEVFLDLLGTMDVKNNPRAVEMKQKYDAQLKRYAQEKGDIQSEAKKLESEVEVISRRGDRCDIGEGLLEASVIIASVTILTRRRWFWYLGMAMGGAGVAVALTALLIR
jgi:hypothetical protein